MRREDAISPGSIPDAFRSKVISCRLMKILSLALAAFTAIVLTSSQADSGKPAFVPEAWCVRCWNGEMRRWEDLGIGKMTIVKGPEATRITNTSGIHRHAHLVHPVAPGGDFTFTIELRGGYELGFLNAEGKDEMLYVELPKKGGDDVDEVPLDKQTFHTYELSRH